MTTNAKPLLLVGCGKMGSAMLSGWLERGAVAGGVSVIEPAGAPEFAGQDGIDIVSDGTQLPEAFSPETVVLAVKPQIMDEAIAPCRRYASSGALFLSIAAGKTIGYFEEHLGSEAAIVRAMPNTPATIGAGITACAANAQADKHQRDRAMSLLEAVGEALMIEDEGLLDAVTGVSGSGPAYVFLLIECLAAAGVDAGLPKELADRLALQTVAGAGQLAVASADSPSTLRENVTSPGGTTQEALTVLMAKDGMAPLMTQAVAAATRRSRELSG